MGTITSKGQVTIPKAVRDLLGLIPGDEVSFEVGDDGRVYLQPKKSSCPSSSRFRQLRGSAKGELSTNQIMSLTCIAHGPK